MQNTAYCAPHTVAHIAMAQNYPYKTNTRGNISLKRGNICYTTSSNSFFTFTADLREKAPPDLPKGRRIKHESSNLIKGQVIDYERIMYFQKPSWMLFAFQSKWGWFLKRCVLHCKSGSFAFQKWQFCKSPVFKAKDRICMSLPQRVWNGHHILMILHSEGSSFSLFFPRETVSFPCRMLCLPVQNALLTHAECALLWAERFCISIGTTFKNDRKKAPNSHFYCLNHLRY